MHKLYKYHFTCVLVYCYFYLALTLHEIQKSLRSLETGNTRERKKTVIVVTVLIPHFLRLAMCLNLFG